jgi:hypothetical protein
MAVPIAPAYARGIAQTTPKRSGKTAAARPQVNPMSKPPSVTQTPRLELEKILVVLASNAHVCPLPNAAVCNPHMHTPRACLQEQARPEMHVCSSCTLERHPESRSHRMQHTQKPAKAMPVRCCMQPCRSSQVSNCLVR